MSHDQVAGSGAPDPSLTPPTASAGGRGRRTRRVRRPTHVGAVGAVGAIGVSVGVVLVAAGLLLAPRAAPVAGADIGTVRSSPAGEPTADVTPPSPLPASEAGAPGPTSPSTTGGTVVAAPPVSLQLPRQGVDAPVVPAGVLTDGQLQLPEDPGSTGWWAAGPSPGQAGSVLIGGHVRTEARGAGALAALGDVVVGDVVVLEDSLGGIHTYAVQSRRSYPKAALPVDVLVGPDDVPRLVLVTCGGQVDPATGHYEDNLVVVAVPA